MKILISLWSVLLLLLPACAHVERATIDRSIDNVVLPKDISDECKTFINSLPNTFKFGFVKVPEDWEHAEISKKIQIFYFGYFQNNSNTTPVVFFNGGPGFSSHGLMPTWKAVLPRIDLSFVTLDQRGTGCSSPYPNLVEKNDLHQFSYYGSRAIVKDAEEIRKRLFGEDSKWKVFGQSYGGLIVHRYVMTFPKSILSAYAHGSPISDDKLGRYYFEMLGLKRISDQYLNQHPSAEARFSQIRSLIKPSLCYAENNFRICGDAIWDGILQYLFNGNSTKELDIALENLVGSDGKLNEVLFNELAQKYVVSMYALAKEDPVTLSKSSSILARIYIGKMEMDNRDDQAKDPGNCKEITKQLISRGQNPKKWIANVCHFITAINIGERPKLQVTRDPITLLALNNTLEENPKLTLYLYSGAKDSFVPSEQFAEEAEISNIKYTQFPNSGHEGFITEKQIWKDLLVK